MQYAVRLFPPVGCLRPSISFNGRTYTCPAGGTLDLPFADAQVAQSNGWVKAADAVGTTAQRVALGVSPTTPFQFHDSTLNLTVVWEGGAWRNPATGTVV